MTQEKGAVTPQETDKDLSGSVQKSPSEAWFSGGLLQGWGAVSLSQEDPLKEGMATHSSIFSWRIPRAEEPAGLHSP